MKDTKGRGGKTAIMKAYRAILISALLAGSILGFSQSNPVAYRAATPAPTAKILADAEAQAKASGRNVLVIFHASWCGWCKRLDKFMTDPTFAPMFDKNFVTVKLTVLEDDKHKGDENPGGLEEMDVLGGRDAGLPLFAILDANGKTIMTSMRPDGDKSMNTGFPAASEEIDHFAAMMKKGAPKISEDQINAMRKYLVDAEVARKAAAANNGGH